MGWGIITVFIVSLKRNCLHDKESRRICPQIDEIYKGIYSVVMSKLNCNITKSLDNYHILPSSAQGVKKSQALKGF